MEVGEGRHLDQELREHCALVLTVIVVLERYCAKETQTSHVSALTAEVAVDD